MSRASPLLIFDQTEEAGFTILILQMKKLRHQELNNVLLHIPRQEYGRPWIWTCVKEVSQGLALSHCRTRALEHSDICMDKNVKIAMSSSQS